MIDRLPNYERSEEFSNIQLLAAEFTQITQHAAIAAHIESGLGDKEKADQAAVNSIRTLLNKLDIRGVIVVGEGVKDKAPMLYIDEVVGTGWGPEIDIALDPVEGTGATAGLKPNALSVLVSTERDGILRLPPELIYMNKLVTGPQAKDCVDINYPVETNLNNIAKALEKSVTDLKIKVLDRPRNQKLIKEIRETGAKVALIDYGDLFPGVLTCIQGSDVHAVMGIGGAPEAVLTAAGVICLGGGIQVKPWTDNEETKKILIEKGFPMNRGLTERSLIPGNSITFSSTGITKGDVLNGVRTFRGGIRTQSFTLTANNGISSISIIDHTDITDVNKIEFRL